MNSVFGYENHDSRLQMWDVLAVAREMEEWEKSLELKKKTLQQNAV